MHISSRTPEGVPNRCPVCGKRVVLEPSDPAGDTPCSHCGHLLWFTDIEGHETLVVKWPEGKTVVVLDELDFNAAGATQLVEEVLSKDVVPDLVLDCSRLRFLSSAALGKLITLDKKVRVRGGRLKLSNVRPEIYELFAITRLDRLFEIEHA